MAEGAGAAFNFQLYRYTPSLAAAVIAVAIFAILTVLHMWRLLRVRAFYFTAFTIGGICKWSLRRLGYHPSAAACWAAESSLTRDQQKLMVLSLAVQTIGYAGRIWSHYDKFSLGGFIIQAILILVAPALYAASIYMILGRLIRTVKGEHLSLIPVQWVTRLFVTGDVIAFSLQAGGGGIQAAGSLEMYEIGEKIIIAGLFVQIFIFGFFVVTSVLFHARLVRSPTAVVTAEEIPWRRYLNVLYITSAIILVRSIFRVVEYLQGNAGYLISHEIFLYIFDALLMAITMAIFVVWYVEHLDGTKRRRSKEDRHLSESSEYGLDEAPPHQRK